MRQRFLVTGAQGFVGRHLIAHLISHFPQSEVMGVGRSSQQKDSFSYSAGSEGHYRRAPLPAYLNVPLGLHYTYVSADLASVDFEDAVRRFRPTRVIHLASTLRGVSETTIFLNNVQSTASLLRVLSTSDIEMLLFASTGGVYGRQDELPIGEWATPGPLDAYSRSKLECEHLVLDFARRTGISTTVARIFNLCGPGQDELHFAGRIAGQIASILAHKMTWRTRRWRPTTAKKKKSDSPVGYYGLVRTVPRFARKAQCRICAQADSAKLRADEAMVARFRYPLLLSARFVGSHPGRPNRQRRNTSGGPMFPSDNCGLFAEWAAGPLLLIF
jgi:nucleoside-diphosphate-sugar epimerase